MHGPAARHDTPSNSAPAKPATAGTGASRADHVVPFHTSASGASSPEAPAAVQARAEVQDTLYSSVPPGLGEGVFWIDQDVPFHASARVTEGPIGPK